MFVRAFSWLYDNGIILSYLTLTSKSLRYVGTILFVWENTGNVKH